jgi:hypothetical protein
LKKRKIEARYANGENGRSTVAQPSVTTGPIKLPQPLKLFSDDPASPVTVVLGGELLGSGDPDLGRELMKTFLLALAEQPSPPEALLLYNAAVRLTRHDSPVFQILRALQLKSTEILVCSASLQHYCPDQPLEVGEIRTMTMLVERMMQAHHILWPK